MDSETAKYLKRTRSSDGVPNRKGGSWPNHPSMRYELPIPFSPGADNVTDEYRENHAKIFGEKPEQKACDSCGRSPAWHDEEGKCELPPAP